jgi:hypothetical protein
MARLIRSEELPGIAIRSAAVRLRVTQELMHTMQGRGEPAVVGPLSRVSGLGDTSRDLTYRLYTICERKGWAQEALTYNGVGG